MISFYLQWLIDYCLVMFAMSLDNIFWIPTSPEYEQYKNNKPITVEGKTYYTKLDYIIKYRIGSVLKSWRDIVPAIITSFLMTLLLRWLV